MPNWMYWESGDYNINRHTVSIVTEASTRLLAFTDGEVDFGSINIEDLVNFCDNLEDKPNVESKAGYICTYRETFTTTLSAFNLHPKVLDAGEDNTNTGANSSLVLNHDCDGDGANDCNVMETAALREAVSYAFDYETHRRETYDNSLAPQYGPDPDWLPVCTYPVRGLHLRPGKRRADSRGSRLHPPVRMRFADTRRCTYCCG